MSIDVDKLKARQMLIKAYTKPSLEKDNIGSAISDILRGSHKTYRYILFTALLAKSTNDKIDILSLQAGDESVGAYDARSLCHNIVVPFEREYIPHSLGDSNEPYLNKPARFQRLSESNAVRAGKDMLILKRMLDILPQIKTSEIAFRYLSHAVYELIEINKEYERQYQFDDAESSVSETTQEILDFIDKVTERTCGGEICPLIVATLENLFYPSLLVMPHKVNECGASSKEIGDIDIYSLSANGEKKDIETSIEVKDKDFSEMDLQHAISKFKSAGLKRSMFVYGKRVKFDSLSVFQLAARYGRTGIYCIVISIIEYAKFRLYDLNDKVNLKDFVIQMLAYAKEINARKATIEWIKDCAQ